MVNIASIVAAVSHNSRRSRKGSKGIESNHPIHTCTNEQHLKWLEEGKCQCCGAPSGEFEGICDECRLS